MRVLRIKFEGYVSITGSFASCFLLLRENDFSTAEVYRIVDKKGIRICSDLQIDLLIEEFCREEGGAFWEAYQEAVTRSFFLEKFPETGGASRNMFRVPRFSEIDFEQVIVESGGYKVPITTHKTPDFMLNDIALELKDLQEESLYDRDRQLALGDLFSRIKSRTVDLDLRLDYGEPTRGYHRLIANKIQKVISKASGQIKDYRERHTVRAAGVILLNTGMYSLPQDLFKTMIADTLARNTRTVEFALVFSQVMQTNGFDVIPLFYCELIGNYPHQVERIREKVIDLIEVKMTQIMISNNSDLFLTSQAPVSFLSGNKIFYWNPGRMRDTRFGDGG